jgi:hypothetical protein
MERIEQNSHCRGSGSGSYGESDAEGNRNQPHLADAGVGQDRLGVLLP